MKRFTATVVVIALILPLVPSFGAENKLPPPGMVVSSVEKDGPAARAGVQEDDLLMSCDGKPVVFVSSVDVICNKARRDGKKSVKLVLKRAEKELKIKLPVSDIPGIDLRPPISDLIAVLYYGCLTSSTPVETDNAKLVAQLAEAARNVVEDDGDIRLAAWTWRLVYKLSTDESPEQRRAAEMVTKLSSELGDGPGEAEGLFMQGIIAQKDGDLKSADDYITRALKIQEELLPGSPLESIMLGRLTTVLVPLAIAAYNESKLPLATEYEKRVLELTKRLVSDNESREYAFQLMAGTLSMLAALEVMQNDVEAGKDYLRQEIAVWEQIGPESEAMAQAWLRLGQLARQHGDPRDAKECYQKALTLLERLTPDNSSVADVLDKLGEISQELGDLKAAREYTERAVCMYERLSPDSEPLAATLNNLGAVCREQGQFKAACNHYERALEIRERLSPDSLDVAYSLNSLGLLALKEGNIDAALELLRRALAIEERLAPDSLQAASVLNNIACVLDDIGDLKGALSCHERALAIKQKHAPDSLAVAVTLDNLGTLAALLDDDKTAREYYERALKIRERLAPDSMDAAYSLHNLGRVISREWDTESALDHIARAIRICREQNGLDLLSSALHYQGYLQQEKGENEVALKSFKEAVDVFESINYTDADSRERVLSDSKSRLYDDLIQLLLEMNKPDEALKYLERAKSKAVVDALNVSSIRTGNEALTNLLKRYADLQAQLKLQQQAIEKEKQKPEGERSLVKIEQLTKLLAQTKAEFYQVVTKIRKDYGPEYSALVQVEPAEFSRIQKELPAGAVVVEYFPAQDKLYIFLVTRDSFKVIERAITRDQLDEWVGEVRDAMDDWKNGLGSQTPPEALVHLYDNIIKPVEKEIDENKTVIFIPSGTLCYLPFAALARKTDDGGLRYLVERDKQFVTLTQMGLLGKLLENDKTASEGRSVGAIAFGNPSGISPALPNAEAEVNTIADIYPDSQAFTCEDASEWRVKLQAQYGRIVHLATHGLLRHDDPNESYIALSEGKDEDGRLTEGEIFGLPLEGTRLVVLSACQTAVAEDNPGREISSLAQAFAIAGAPTVIASLWSVSDASTGKLMSELYRKLAEGKSKAEALQSAQRLLIAGEEHRHPFFWAGFTLLGAWE